MLTCNMKRQKPKKPVQKPKTPSTGLKRARKAVEDLKLDTGAAIITRKRIRNRKAGVGRVHRHKLKKHDIVLTLASTPFAFRKRTEWHASNVSYGCAIFARVEKSIKIDAAYCKDQHCVRSAVDALLLLCSFLERTLDPEHARSKSQAANVHQMQFPGSEVVMVYKVSEAAAAVVLLLHQRGLLKELQDCTLEEAVHVLLDERFVANDPVGNDPETVIEIYHYLDALVAKPGAGFGWHI